MKKIIFALGLLLICFVPVSTVYAGSLNSYEKQVVAAAKKTYEYDGVKYRVASSYINQLMGYLTKDGVDLTAEQRDQAIQTAFANIENGVEGGYLIPISSGNTQKENTAGNNDTDNSGGNTDSDTDTDTDTDMDNDTDIDTGTDNVNSAPSPGDDAGKGSSGTDGVNDTDVNSTENEYADNTAQNDMTDNNAGLNDISDTDGYNSGDTKDVSSEATNPEDGNDDNLTGGQGDDVSVDSESKTDDLNNLFTNILNNTGAVVIIVLVVVVILIGCIAAIKNRLTLSKKK